MKIPKIVIKNNNIYRFEKEYINFIMYRNIKTGVKECFKRQELGIIKNPKKISNISPEKVKK